MCRHAVFCLIFSFMIHSRYSPTAGHWVYLRSSAQPRISDDIRELSNETELSEQPLDNNVTSTTENGILFWTASDTKETNEADSEIQMASDTLDEEPESVNNTSQASDDSTEMETNDNTSENTRPLDSIEGSNDKVEENKGNDVTYNDVPDSVMDEKIVLQRNNCHLEIAVPDSYDLKIEIQFGKLQNNTSGKCCITLNGQGNTMLGIFISNVYLYKNASQGEVLKVITSQYGTEFVLKEYYSWTKYAPLLLTETHKAYLVLYYNVASVPASEQDSHFNLEVFSYHKYENYVHHGNSNSDSYFSYTNDVQNVPINQPAFAPYFY